MLSVKSDRINEMEKAQTYTDAKTQAGLSIVYVPHEDGSVAVPLLGGHRGANARFDVASDW